MPAYAAYLGGRGDVGRRGSPIAGGAPLMLVYCLGLGIPFLVIALLADRAQGFIHKVNRQLGLISIIAGAVLFAFGLLLAIGKVALLSTYALQSPFDI